MAWKCAALMNTAREANMNHEVRIRFSFLVAPIFTCLTGLLFFATNHLEHPTLEQLVYFTIVDVIFLFTTGVFWMRSMSPLLYVGETGIRTRSCGFISWNQITNIEFELINPRLLFAPRALFLICSIKEPSCVQLERNGVLNWLRGVTRKGHNRLRINLSMAQFIPEVTKDVIYLYYLRHHNAVELFHKYQDLCNLDPNSLTKVLVKRHRRIRMSLRIAFFLSLGLFFLAAANNYL
jgi:hypothetical protein